MSASRGLQIVGGATVLRPAAGTELCEDADGLMLAGSSAHRLNESAALVWERLDGTASLDEIATRIAGDLGVETTTVWADIVRLAVSLIEAGLAHPA